MHRETSDETIRRVLSIYEIGPKLRRLRLKKKLSLVDLGASTGLSPSMLSQLENGKLIPTLPTLLRLAQTFNVELGHFLSGKRSEHTFSIVRAGQRIRFPEVPDAALPSYLFEVLAFGMPEKEFSPYLAEFPKRTGREPQPHTETNLGAADAVRCAQLPQTPTGREPQPHTETNLGAADAVRCAQLPQTPTGREPQPQPETNLGAADAVRCAQLPQTPTGRDPQPQTETNSGAADTVRCARDTQRPSSNEHRSHSHPGAEFVHVLEGVLAIRYEGEEHVLNAGDSVYFDASEPHSYAGHSDNPAKAIVVTFPLPL